MKRIDYLSIVCNLLKFKTVKINGVEFVLLADNEIDNNFENQIVNDHTAFEAIQNHVHLLNNLNRNEFQKACQLGEQLAELVFQNLKFNFPDKKFYVFATVACSKYDGLIIRFHQMWENEYPYYEESIGVNEAVIMKKG